MKVQHRRTLALTLWCAAWVALAATLWWWAYPKQLERGCWMGEWPFEQGCSDYAGGSSPENPATLYTHHLQKNIGDSQAYVRLTQRWWITEPPRANALLPNTQALAPHDNRVLAMQADTALRSQDWPAAAKALVLLMERGLASARQPLVAMMLDPSTQASVQALLNKESRWLDPTLAGLDAKAPMALLLPFVSEGLQLGVVRPATAIAMVERLKSTGHWVDAYALWVATLGQVNEGLYNAGFDQRATHRGFDWIWPRPPPGKQGVRVNQIAAAPKAGSMLQLELTGRAALAQPMVSQSLVLFGERYKLTGQYMSDRFRTREGVVWAMRCAQGGERFAQTAALKDTQRQWVPLELEFELPATCAGAVRLQLETTALWEAKSGLSGVLHFDDFELKPWTPTE